MCMLSTTTAINDSAELASAENTDRKRRNKMRALVTEATGFKDLAGFEKQMWAALDREVAKRRAPDPYIRERVTRIEGGPRGFGGNYSFGFNPGYVVSH